MLLDSVPMKNRKLRITEKDFLLANRRASRAEEIERHGKQISMRKLTHKSKKVYDRNLMKRAGINSNDNLPFSIYPSPRCVQSAVLSTQAR